MITLLVGRLIDCDWLSKWWVVNVHIIQPSAYTHTRHVGWFVRMLVGSLVWCLVVLSGWLNDLSVGGLIDTDIDWSRLVLTPNSESASLRNNQNTLNQSRSPASPGAAQEKDPPRWWPQDCWRYASFGLCLRQTRKRWGSCAAAWGDSGILQESVTKGSPQDRLLHVQFGTVLLGTRDVR